MLQPPGAGVGHAPALFKTGIMIRSAILLATALGILACSGEGPANQSAQPAAAPVSAVDSIFPVEEEIRRFKLARNGVGATHLEGGTASRDELVDRFLTALQQQDTTVLRALVLSAGEYIDLYYPTSMYFRAPYKQSPELNWFLMQENSNKGFTRLLRRYGGKPTGFEAYTCAEKKTEGMNTLHDRCTITWALQPATMRVFSTIIERAGRFKIMSYANDL